MALLSPSAVLDEPVEQLKITKSSNAIKIMTISVLAFTLMDVFMFDYFIVLVSLCYLILL